MSTIINVTDCTTSRKNLGYGDCVVDVKQIIGAFLVPSTFKLDAAALASKATAIAALRAAAADDNKGRRIFPIHKLKNPQNNSDDKTVQSFSDGSEAVVREGLQKWMFQITAGGLSLHSALRTHNQNGGYFIFYDSNFTIYGWQKNEGEIWGIPCDHVWADPWRANDGSNTTNYGWGVAFAPRYVNEGVGFAIIDSTIEGIEGLQDVKLTEVAFDGDTGVAEVAAVLERGGTNMAELYGTELAAVGMWNASNASTGNAITIEAVSVMSGSNPRFQVTLDNADTDYPTAGTILLSLAAPSVLDAAGVEGFESNEIELATTASS